MAVAGMKTFGIPVVFDVTATNRLAALRALVGTLKQARLTSVGLDPTVDVESWWLAEGDDKWADGNDNDSMVLVPERDREHYAADREEPLADWELELLGMASEKREEPRQVYLVQATDGDGEFWTEGVYATFALALSAAQDDFPDGEPNLTGWGVGIGLSENGDPYRWIERYEVKA